MSPLLKSPPKPATVAVRRSSTSTQPSGTARGKSPASRAGSSGAGRKLTGQGILTLVDSPEGPRFRLHATRREQLEAARKLLLDINQAMPGDSPEEGLCWDAADCIGRLLRTFTAPCLPSDRAENQLPAGDRIDS
jgi:hypothetical protein